MTLVAMFLAASFLAIARDPAPNQAESGIVEGCVTGPGREHRPVPGAKVTLTYLSDRVSLETEADASGRFRFDHVAANRFQLVGRHAGFVSTQYGNVSPDEEGTPLVIERGEHLQNLCIALQPGSRIAGRLLDSTGQAAAGVRIYAVPPSVLDPRFERVVPRPSTTDKDGLYQLDGLPRGSYFVVASSFDRLEPRLVNLAAQTGAQPFVETPVFYPGATVRAEAQLVTVDGEGEKTNVNFSLSYAAAVTLVISIFGRPPDQALPVKLSVESLDLPLAVGGGATHRAMSINGGEAIVSGLAPGRYRIRAVRDDRSVGGALVRGGTDADLIGPTTAVAIGLSDPIRLQGMLTYASRSEPAPGSRRRVLLQRRRAPLVSSFDLALVEQSEVFEADVDAGGQFLFQDLPAGNYEVTVRDSADPAPAHVARISSGDEDRWDGTWDVHESRTLTLTIARQPTVLSGVVDAAGVGPATGYRVIAIVPGTSNGSGPLVYMQRLDNRQGFSFERLPPGRYVLALLRGASGDAPGPETLDEVGRSGIPVSVSLGQTTVQNIRLK